jgi:hypothetical protein
MRKIKDGDIVKLDNDDESVNNQYVIVAKNVRHLTAYSLWKGESFPTGYIIKNVKTQKLFFVNRTAIKIYYGGEKTLNKLLKMEKKNKQKTTNKKG